MSTLFPHPAHSTQYPCLSLHLWTAFTYHTGYGHSPRQISAPQNHIFYFSVSSTKLATDNCQSTESTVTVHDFIYYSDSRHSDLSGHSTLMNIWHMFNTFRAWFTRQGSTGDIGVCSIGWVGIGKASHNGNGTQQVSLHSRNSMILSTSSPSYY